MQIERVWSQIVRLPADEPLADGKTAPGATRDIVVVKVATKDGIEGLGATFLGGYRVRVPAYASGALMRSLSLDEVVTAAGRLKERGWTAMKTQLALPGGTRPEPEVDRIRRIREVIGPEIRLMCDINQRWTV